MLGYGEREPGGGETLSALRLATAIALEAVRFPATTIDSRRSAAVAPTPVMQKDSKVLETAPILETRKCSLRWDHARTLAMQKDSKASETATTPETRKCSLRWDHVLALATWTDSRLLGDVPVPAVVTGSMVRTLEMASDSPRAPLPVQSKDMVATPKKAIFDHLVLPTLDWRHAIMHRREMVATVRLTDTVRTLGFKGNGGRRRFPWKRKKHPPKNQKFV